MSKNTYKIHENFLEELSNAVKEENISAVIHAGDWSVAKQDQFYKTMKMFREYIPNIPILTVRGNHDVWDRVDGYKVKQKRHWGQLKVLHKKWFKELDIHHLEEGPYAIKDVIICGFDGWYGNANPPTNDEHNMISNIEGCPSMLYHSSRAHRELTRVIDTDISQYSRSICVSHFPPYGGDYKSGYDPNNLTFCANPKYLDIIADKFNVFCTGHSHDFVDRFYKNCRLLNAGSDYNLPKFIIFEV